MSSSYLIVFLSTFSYFSLIRSFMEYGATVWDPYQKYNSDTVERVQRRAARFVKSRYSRYSSVSDMLDVLEWTPLSQRRQEARLILFYKIINGLAQVLVEAYKGTRRKHNMKFRQIGHTTSQYGQLFFPNTISAWNGLAFAEAPSLAVFRSKFLNNYHAFIPHNTIKGSCGILNQNQNRNPSHCSLPHSLLSMYINYLLFLIQPIPYRHPSSPHLIIAFTLAIHMHLFYILNF